MNASLALDLLSLRIAIESDDELILSLLTDLWQPFVASGEGGAQDRVRITRRASSWHAEVLDRDEFTTTDGWELLDRVSSDIFQYVVRVGNGFLDIHAAVLEREGNLVLIAGAPGAGKTTMTLELLGRPGWTYLSDDLAALDVHAGDVAAFPKPLSLKDAFRWEEFESRWPVAGVLGKPRGNFVLPASVFPHKSKITGRPTQIVFPDRHRQAGGCRPVSPAQTIYRFGSYISQWRMDAAAMLALRRLATQTRVADVSYGGVSTGADLIEELMAGA